jgi:hypothetical protein
VDTLLVVPDVSPLGTAALPWSSNRIVKEKGVALPALVITGLACKVAVLVTSGAAQEAVTSVLKIGSAGDVPTVLRNPPGSAPTLMHHS